MSRLSGFLFSCVIATSVFSGCGKKSTAPSAPEPLKPEQCEEYCNRITSCARETIDLIWESRRGDPAARGEALQMVSDRNACMTTCRDQLNPAHAEKFPDDHKYHQFFMRNQMACMSYKDCRTFAVCRHESLFKSVAEYPLDPLESRRCNDVCARIHQCANILAPRLFAAEFAELPLDKQADMVRRVGDRDRCHHSCRFSMIRRNLERKALKSALEETAENIQPYMNCLAHQDCAEYAKCVQLQGDGEM